MEEVTMNFTPGMELVVGGMVNADAARFSINFGNSKDAIAMHLDQRFNFAGDIETIVMNSYVKGEWEEEVRSRNFPFSKGGKFEVAIHFNTTSFDVYLADGSKVEFPNRFGKKSYSLLFFQDGARIEEVSLKKSARPTRK